MTDVTKNQIRELREKGYGYKRISKELSISISQIRYAVDGFNKEAAVVSIGTCKECGMRIVSQKGKKKKLFCSDACRMKWWNSHLDQVNRKANYTIVCQHCGKEFVVYGNAKRKFCCHTCYAKSRNKNCINDCQKVVDTGEL